jgi:hypothetical protein
MPNGHEPDQVMVGAGRWRVGVRGTLASTLIMLAAVVGATLWSGYRVERAVEQQSQVLATYFQRASDEHLWIALTQDRTSCILAMTPEERTQFRKSAERFSKWCQWVRD